MSVTFWSMFFRLHGTSQTANCQSKNSRFGTSAALTKLLDARKLSVVKFTEFRQAIRVADRKNRFCWRKPIVTVATLQRKLFIECFVTRCCERRQQQRRR